MCSAPLERKKVIRCISAFCALGIWSKKKTSITAGWLAMKHRREGTAGPLEGNSNSAGWSGREDAFMELVGLGGKLTVEEGIQTVLRKRKWSQTWGNQRYRGTNRCFSTNLELCSRHNLALAAHASQGGVYIVGVLVGPGWLGSASGSWCRLAVTLQKSSISRPSVWDHTDIN